MNQKLHKNNQIFWYSSANYLGFFLGFIASVFLYPSNLNFLGEIRYIETIGQFIFPILLFGLPQALIKFSPFMKDYHLPRFFGNAILIISFLSTFVFIILKIIDYFIPFNNFNFIIYGFVLAVCLAFIDLIKSRAITLQKVNIPIFFEKVIPKIVLPIFFILLFKNHISSQYSIIGYLFSYLLIVIILFAYLFQFSKPVFSTKYYFLFENYSIKQFVNYSFYSFVGSFASLIAFRIDNFMIPQFLSMEDNGAYSIALTISGLIGLPATGIFALNSPIISQLIENKNIKELGDKYIETAKLLFWIGGIFFSLVIVSLPFIPQIFNEYSYSTEMPMIFFILSCSVLINIGTGFNTEIILYSKYFRFNLITVLLLVSSNIGLNLYFLTKTDFGILGVAVASLVSIILYNLIKLVFIYNKFKIIPFDKNYYWVIISVLSTAIFAYLLPDFASFLPTIIIKSFLILTLNIFVVYKLNLIVNISNLVSKYLKKL